MLFTSAYGTGAALLALTAQGAKSKRRNCSFTRELQNHHGGVVLVNGYIYGFNNSILTCIDFATGNTMWRHRSVGKGSLTYADGNLYLLGEDNVVGLAEAVPRQLHRKGPIQDSGSRIAELGASSRGWRTAVHPQPGNAGLLRHSREVTP
mgnify:CR=1 FL=1